MTKWANLDSVNCQATHAHAYTQRQISVSVNIGKSKFDSIVLKLCFSYAGNLAYLHDKRVKNFGCEGSVSVRFLVRLSCDATADACGGSGRKR